RDPPLVGRVGEGVDQRDGERVDPRQLRELRADVGVVELADHRAVGGDALVDLDGVLQRGEGLRLGPDDPAREPARHVGTGDLQHLAEALGRDEPDRGALALQDRVGGDGGAVQHLRDVRQGDARLVTDLRDAVAHADGLVGGRGGGLGAPRRPASFLHEQHVGERPADVDAEPIRHVSPWEAARTITARALRMWAVMTAWAQAGSPARTAATISRWWARLRRSDASSYVWKLRRTIGAWIAPASALAI